MRKLFSLFTLFLIFSQVFAQNSNEIISARIISSVDKIKPGDSYQIAVEVQIKEPYHINAQKPSEDYLIPTTLNLKSGEGIAIGQYTYPDAEMKTFAFSESPLAVYEETIYIFTTISVSPDYTGTEIPLNGTIGYQACDDQTCQAPDELSFSEMLPVATPDEKITPINQEIFASMPTAAQISTENVEESGLSKILAQKGWFLTFALVFLGGLALNLTPCVYPLIPITISYFGGQAEGKRGSVVSHAIIYVLGMAITYSILGVIAAITGSLFGAALQNPIVLIFIALVLVILSLSMFDLYEIRVPAFLSNFAGGAKKGYFGTFFMGLTVGIVAAPCIGPFVLALLTFVGERGDVFLGFWLFFVLALGLGVPFLFLGIFSGSINKIPRSGAWMIWVRKIFGFILIAMAIYFLDPLIPNTLLYHFSLALTMLLGGIYMAWIEPTTSTGKVFPVIRNLIGIIFFVIAVIFGTLGIQSYFENNVQQMQALSGEKAADQIQWFNYSGEKLDEAVSTGKPVMIDFYADWCIPCKELEKFTFSDPDVVDISRQFIMLKVDLTKSNDARVKELKDLYQIKGVPTLVFIDAQGNELSKLRVVGFMEKEDFLPIMESALAAS
jgi:thiol:disulfide interchange protein DsbD